MNVEIASRLATLRKERGLSQEELAQKLGISRQAVSKWERAESSPDTSNLIALSKLYNISLDVLLEADEESIENETYSQQFSDNNTNKAETNCFINDMTHIHANRIEQMEHMRPKSKLFYFPYPLLIVAIFMLLGWLTGKWNMLWPMFLTIPIYYGIATYSNIKSK